LRVFEEGGVSKVNVRFQRPGTVDNAGRNQFHGKGLLVYGVPAPESEKGIELTNTASVLPGRMNPANDRENGLQRQSEISVIRGDTFEVRLRTEPDRANLAGLTNLDVAISSAAGMNGFSVGTLYDGDHQIPIIARLRMEERAQLDDIQSLYVYSSQGSQKVPLRAISTVEFDTKIEKLQRRNQFRTITVSTFPVSGTLPSEVLDAVHAKIDAFAKTLPPGYRLEIGGEYEEQVKGFLNLAICANARVYQAMARDRIFFDAFAQLHPRFRTPVVALVAQGAWAIVLLLSGTYGELLDYVVFGDWIFFGLTAATLFYFRRRDAQAGAASPQFVTPAWQLSVILFVAAAIYVVAGSVMASPGNALRGTALILLGVPLYLWRRRAGLENRGGNG